MPRGFTGKSLLGGNGTSQFAGNVITGDKSQNTSISGYLQDLNLKTQTQGNVKNVEDLQQIIGIFNVAVANIAATKKTLSN
jgi:hypothetical protein